MRVLAPLPSKHGLLMTPPGGRPQEIKDGRDVPHRLGINHREHLERVRYEEDLKSEAAAVRWLIEDDERRRNRRSAKR